MPLRALPDKFAAGMSHGDVFGGRAGFWDRIPMLAQALKMKINGLADDFLGFF